MANKKRWEYLKSSTIEKNISYYLDRGQIYIPYCVVSSKNCKQISYSFKSKRKVLKPSDQYCLYHQLSKPYYLRQRKYFLDLIRNLPKPIILGFHHIRYNKEHWDHHNMIQGPADMMQECGWIEDDDAYNVEIHPDGFTVDRENQGLVITPYSGVTFNKLL